MPRCAHSSPRLSWVGTGWGWLSSFSPGSGCSHPELFCFLFQLLFQLPSQALPEAIALGVLVYFDIRSKNICYIFVCLVLSSCHAEVCAVSHTRECKGSASERG